MLRYANVTAQASGCDMKLQHVGASGYPYGWGCLGNSVWPAHVYLGVVCAGIWLKG